MEGSRSSSTSRAEGDTFSAPVSCVTLHIGDSPGWCEAPGGFRFWVEWPLFFFLRDWCVGLVVHWHKLACSLHCEVRAVCGPAQHAVVLGREVSFLSPAW